MGTAENCAGWPEVASRGLLTMAIGWPEVAKVATGRPNGLPAPADTVVAQPLFRSLWMWSWNGCCMCGGPTSWPLNCSCCGWWWREWGRWGGCCCWSGLGRLMVGSWWSICNGVFGGVNCDADSELVRKVVLPGESFPFATTPPATFVPLPPQRCVFNRSMSKGLAPETVKLHCFR